MPAGILARAPARPLVEEDAVAEEDAALNEVGELAVAEAVVAVLAVLDVAAEARALALPSTTLASPALHLMKAMQ